MTDFANELVSEVFGHEEEETQECMRLDLARLGPEETARLLTKADKILQGLLWTFDDRENLPLYLVLLQAKEIATEARMRAEKYTAA